MLFTEGVSRTAVGQALLRQQLLTLASGDAASKKVARILAANTKTSIEAVCIYNKKIHTITSLKHIPPFQVGLEQLRFFDIISGIPYCPGHTAYLGPGAAHLQWAAKRIRLIPDLDVIVDREMASLSTCLRDEVRFYTAPPSELVLY